MKAAGSGASVWARIDHHIFEGILGIGVLLVGLFGALIPVLGVTGPLPPLDTREVQIDGAAQVPGAVASGTVSLRGTHRAELAVTDPGLGDRLLLAAPEVVHSFLVVTVLCLLMRMARTFREGDVFVPANVRRLLRIALAVLLAGMVVPLLDMLTTKALVGGTSLEPAVVLTYTPSTTAMLLSLLIAAAADTFQHGARLRADTEGLI